MGVEFELKYRATQTAMDQLARDITGWDTITMETTYYDTPSQALSKRRYTLRRRLENGVSVCTVKTPAKAGGRGEWELRSDSIEEAIPELCKLGPSDLEELTAEGVVPFCGARFVRRVALVHLGETVMELALDTGILFSGEHTEPLCEVEVELKRGQWAQVQAYGQLFMQKYGLIPEKHSKFRRALSLWEENQHGAVK